MSMSNAAKTALNNSIDDNSLKNQSEKPLDYVAYRLTEHGKSGVMLH